MSFQALLVTEDNEAAGALSPVLAGFSLGVQCCTYAQALDRLRTQRFHTIIADFEDPQAAFQILQHDSGAVTAVLLSDKTKIRNAFGAGANFVLYKPIAVGQAEATLRAAVALLKRERRRSIRVPLQVPVWLRVQTRPEVEGILLDVSDDGMEALSPHPLCPLASIGFHFDIPGAVQVEGRGEVAWASPNGQAGIRFADLSDEVSKRLKEWISSNTRLQIMEEPLPGSHSQLTDLSLGGCYAETESPFPERSAVILCLKAAGIEIERAGTVRVMHPSFGMGVEFAPSPEEEREQLRAFIELLNTRTELIPELLVNPTALKSPLADDVYVPRTDLRDPLLELLHHHDSMSLEEFLSQLHGQRSAAVGTG